MGLFRTLEYNSNFGYVRGISIDKSNGEVMLQEQYEVLRLRDSARPHSMPSGTRRCRASFDPPTQSPRHTMECRAEGSHWSINAEDIAHGSKPTFSTKQGVDTTPTFRLTTALQLHIHHDFHSSAAGRQRERTFTQG